MKVRVLSDLHLEFGSFEPPPADADVVVLAGDIGTGAEGIRWARNTFPSHPTIYVLGNHELYGSEFYDAIDVCRLEARKVEIILLENEAAVVDGVRFLGATLWSDYCLYGTGTQATSMLAAASSINDFRMVKIIGGDGVKRAFRPADALVRYHSSRAILESELAKPFEGQTVVVTHFLPSKESVAKRFAGSPLNPYFASELRGLIETYQPALWIHGHTHDSADYRIGRTRVVCNPRGYSGYETNPAFAPSLVVEI